MDGLGVSKFSLSSRRNDTPNAILLCLSPFKVTGDGWTRSFHFQIKEMTVTFYGSTTLLQEDTLGIDPSIGCTSRLSSDVIPFTWTERK